MKTRLTADDGTGTVLANGPRAVTSVPTDLRLGRALVAIVRVAWRRQVRSVQTLVALGLVALLLLFVGIQSLWGWPAWAFGRGLIAGTYFGFVVPILGLCLGTQLVGDEWEEGSLLWLLSRPVPRWAIYLAKYLAALPWALAITLGGLLGMGWLGDRTTWSIALAAWPGVVSATVAYLALFACLGVTFRRSTIIGVTYALVIESTVGSMPGLMKRASISFYARCLFYDVARAAGLDRLGIAPDKESFFRPVSGEIAIAVLALATAVLILLGILIFSRRQYVAN